MSKIQDTNQSEAISESDLDFDIDLTRVKVSDP
jgi:hypothetical protein